MRRRIVVAAMAAAVVAAGGGVAYAQAQGSSGSYRTAAVAVGDVDRTLTLSGTIAASARQDLSFGVSGTVTKVKVEVGDVVRSGAELATLDDTDLQTAVTKARATLAKAEAQLESDQDSQTTTVAAATGGSGSSSPGSGSGTASKPSAGGSTSAVSPKLKAALAALQKEQAAVTGAQTEATTAIAAAKTALAAQTEACKTVDDPEPAESAEGSAAGLSDECTAALDAVQAAQDVVADKQATLQTALEALGKTLAGGAAELQKSAGSGAASSSPSDDSGTTSSPSTGSTTSTPSTGSTAGGAAGGTVSAASLAQDQASIDTAKAALTEAKRNRDAAGLTAPFSGKILSVSNAKGDTVAADDVVIVIVGDGDTTATTTVTADQVSEVKKGQKASVTPAGAATAVTGTVTSIGLLPDSSSDTTAYPVTIELTGSVAAPEGSTASIALVIGTAKDVLTVPSSAVSTTGRTTVSVLTDGNPVPTPVTVGVVGPTRTSITQGLKKGQKVVIADLDAALPSAGTTTTRFPGAGGFNGAPGGAGRGLGG